MITEHMNTTTITKDEQKLVSSVCSIKLTVTPSTQYSSHYKLYNKKKIFNLLASSNSVLHLLPHINVVPAKAKQLF